MTRGLILAAPASGSGKTTLTLGILRALKARNIPARGGKSGPDYIDPRFHEAACGRPCFNLDAWAMPPDRIRTLAAGDGLLVIEGAMGLFDGAPPDGKGATADLARILGLPVILIVDTAKMAHSVAPLVAGFARHDPAVRIAGIILNNTGSPRHEAMLRRALDPVGIPILGAVPRQSGLTHPARHLGLVQAMEREDLEMFLDRVAEVVSGAIDLDVLTGLADTLPDAPATRPAAPPAQRIAIASDAAFAFSYPHLMNDWQQGGAELSFFSPLADQAPAPADLIILPGGYPELHAGRLAAAMTFRKALCKAAASTAIYGECGGYMVLGEGLTDAAGKRHAMLGLLQLETSFATRKLHLGYRRLAAFAGPFTGALTGHEFHYATTLHAEGKPLYGAEDASGVRLPDMGLVSGRVCGSFAHVIDTAPPFPSTTTADTHSP